MQTPTNHLLYILDTINLIDRASPHEKLVFLSDLNAQDASLMRLQDIGEQLARIRNKYPDYYEKNHTDEWIQLIGLRNVISHGYHEIDFEIIWDIIDTKLAPFKRSIETLTQ